MWDGPPSPKFPEGVDAEQELTGIKGRPSEGTSTLESGSPKQESNISRIQTTVDDRCDKYI